MKEKIHILRKIFPEDQVIYNQRNISAYATDASLIKGKTSLVVLIEGPEDVRKVLSFCHKYKMKFVARGRATGYTGGCVPLSNSIVVSFERWRQVENIDFLSQTITVAPGTTIGEINAVAQPAGLFFPPDPVSKDHCTIGGAVSENSSGPRCLRYGPTHQFIEKVEFFLPNGKKLNIKKYGKEYWDPYFFTLIGAEGTLGIIGRITCKLVRMSNYISLIRLEFNSPDIISILQEKLYDSKINFSAMEMITPTYSPILGIKGPYILYLESFCNNRKSLKTIIELIHKVLHNFPVHIKSEIGNLYLHRAEGYRKSRSLISNSLEKHPIAQLIDGVVCRRYLGNAVKDIFDIAKRYNCPLLHTFHFGDGNIHPTFFHSLNNNTANHKQLILQDITSLCLKYDGCIAGEHGIGLEKKVFFL